MSIIKSFKTNPPKISLIIVFVCFSSLFLSLYWPNFYQFALLFPTDIYSPDKYYKFFSYNLFINGFFNWFYYSVIMLLSGYKVEETTSKKVFLVLIFSSSIAGALVYSAMSITTGFERPLGSPIMILCAFAACAIVLILKQYSKANKSDIIVAILLLLFLFTISTANIEFFYGQITAILVGLIFGVFIKT